MTEDFAPLIYEVFPEQSPFFTVMQRWGLYKYTRKCSALRKIKRRKMRPVRRQLMVRHDWITDTLVPFPLDNTP